MAHVNYCANQKFDRQCNSNHW